MLQKQIEIEQSILESKNRLNSLRTKSRQIVQDLCNWYLVQRGLKELPVHIRDTVQKLDKFAYGSKK